MSRKSTRQCLDSDKLDSQKQKWAAPFPPKKRAPELIAATQEEDNFDCERVSLRSKSSLSTRIRLQEKYRIIDENPAGSASPSNIKDWIKQHATNVMAQSSNHYDVDSADAANGGFKCVQVRVYFRFSNQCISPLALISVRM